MSMWTRLFARSKSPQPTSKPRLALEPLDAREVPAVVVVSGWGSSQYQYAYNDPAVARPADPMVSKLAATNPDATQVAASDYLLEIDGIKGESADRHATQAPAADYLLKLDGVK